jgi:predicted nuclease with TOPRIM domain
MLITGCRSGTAPQELAQLRARVSTLEAENAHLQGQVSLAQAERDQLREQNNALATDLAKAQAGVGGDVMTDVTASGNLVVLPREVRPGEWVAVHVRSLPIRLLPQTGVALRSTGEANLAQVSKLASANLFLLPIPHTVQPGTYRVVFGQAGLEPGAKIDDQVTITIQAP